MFIHVYPVSYQGDEIYNLSSEQRAINTTQIVAITLKSESPKMKTSEQQEKIEKIFDTKLNNLAIFSLEFSNQKYEYVIGPKSKFENIK